MIAGKHWYLMNEMSASEALLYSSSELGMSVQLPFGTYDPRLLYKFPSSANITYPYPDIMYYLQYIFLVDTNFVCTVISTSVSVTVPAGTYQCYQYRIHHPPSPYWWEDLYLAPGVGWVQKDFYAQRYPTYNFFLASSAQATTITLR